MSREEARISTPTATFKNNARPDAARKFATSGNRSDAVKGRMMEQAVFGYFFPREQVTRRKGGRGQKTPQYLQHRHEKAPHMAGLFHYSTLTAKRRSTGH
ncbi:hypothetical protein [Pseudomonas sp. BP8]|uniref:hypothetical protein n=1 Tax=Pseudomonas sp. BP8 TaxID=2817864 RepID=UPI001AE57F88|nr:hypothetical protein [Pseudomonas sp. BP8]MBP2262677.1 hypothetical protein [Pseudomonas sp. BP8]